ncbi:hypothetical protein LTR42_009511 [Elasticomyces elasticus]|nr:hypothetical protein LTR42_009511 [Elasticomyces elasticus]
MVVPMYMSEISPPEIRGTLVVTQQLSITLGILVRHWLEYGTHYIGGVRCAPNTSYTGGTSAVPTFDPYNDVPLGGCTGQSQVSGRVPLALQNLPALLLGIGMFYFTETPRWLLMSGQDERVLRSLSRLRKRPEDDMAVARSSLLTKRKSSSNGLLQRSLTPARVGFLWQLPNAMIYYAPTIFSQLILSGNTSSLLATGVYGIVNTLSKISALLLIDRLGRRKLLMAGAAGTMISLVIVGGIIGGFGSSLVSHKAAGWVGIAFIYIYDINFSYSFAPIGWVLPSEIFNLGNRSKSISITTSATWMCNFIIGLVTPSMLAKLGWGTYIFFAAFCLMAFFFVWFCIPETKGKSLEDMDVVFGDTAAHGEEKLHLYQIFADLRDDEGFIVGSEKA